MADHFVSVIIPHYNAPQSLALCLDALERQTIPQSAYEIIVADNMSPVGIEAVKHAVAARGRIVEVPIAGAGPTRNGGVTIATGEILAFTDSDCVPDPAWIENGIEALKSADIVGGKMIVTVASTQRMTAAEAFEKVFAFANEDYVKRKHFTVTANLFVRRNDFDRVGGFRVGVSEDQEWCLRARALGLDISYAENAVVAHPARREWADLIRKWRRIISEQYQITVERPFGLLRWIAKTSIIPLSIIVHIPKIFLSRNTPGLRNRMAALCGLVRIRLWRFVASTRIIFSRSA